MRHARTAALARSGYETLDDYLAFAELCCRNDQDSMFFGECKVMQCLSSVSLWQLMRVAAKARSRVGGPSEADVHLALDAASAAAVSASAAADAALAQLHAVRPLAGAGAPGAQPQAAPPFGGRNSGAPAAKKPTGAGAPAGGSAPAEESAGLRK